MAVLLVGSVRKRGKWKRKGEHERSQRRKEGALLDPHVENGWGWASKDIAWSISLMAMFSKPGAYSPTWREKENAHYLSVESSGVGPITLGGKTWQRRFKPTRGLKHRADLMLEGGWTKQHQQSHNDASPRIGTTLDDVSMEDLKVCVCSLK